ncbi:TPA: CRISPR-associated protein Cas4 [bacterium]|nr:CRISPR-associated protein Cas4 [bacterium]
MVTGITGTLVQSYSICRRQCWFMSRQILPDQDHPFLEIGRLIDNDSYERDRKKIELEDIVIDLIKIKEDNVVIGEVKKSSRAEESAKIQLAYYLYRLKEAGVIANGVLLFPKEKKRIQVELTPDLETELLKIINEIEITIKSDSPPPSKKIKYCTNCAYREFCWS